MDDRGVVDLTRTPGVVDLTGEDKEGDEMDEDEEDEDYGFALDDEGLDHNDIALIHSILADLSDMDDDAMMLEGDEAEESFGSDSEDDEGGRGRRGRGAAGRGGARGRGGRAARGGRGGSLPSFIPDNPLDFPQAALLPVAVLAAAEELAVVAAVERKLGHETIHSTT